MGLGVPIVEDNGALRICMGILAKICFSGVLAIYWTNLDLSVLSHLCTHDTRYFPKGAGMFCGLNTHERAICPRM